MHRVDHDGLELRDVLCLWLRCWCQDIISMCHHVQLPLSFCFDYCELLGLNKAQVLPTLFFSSANCWNSPTLIWVWTTSLRSLWLCWTCLPSSGWIWEATAFNNSLTVWKGNFMLYGFLYASNNSKAPMKNKKQQTEQLGAHNDYKRPNWVKT